MPLHWQDWLGVVTGLDFPATSQAPLHLAGLFNGNLLFIELSLELYYQSWYIGAVVGSERWFVVSAHMLRMCLWHTWSEVCWLFHCFFDCLKALNVNSTYGRHIPLEINHMSDIIRHNDFNTVISERIIFLLCKLQYTNAHDIWNGYVHWNQ